MKLIIDISDELFKDIQDNILFGDEYHDAVWELNGAIINGTPLENITSEIREEKEFAYADFEQYKVDYLGCDAEYVEDELPNDDYRYGMERCLEIINQHISGKDGEQNK